MEQEKQQARPLIAVVGPCAAGKSTLVKALRERGYNAHEVVQEHSYAPTMWQRVTQPDLLIYLDVSWESALRRCPTYMDTGWWEKLGPRLQHAREHADLYIHTDDITPAEVLDRALAFLKRLSPE